MVDANAQLRVPDGREVAGRPQLMLASTRASAVLATSNRPHAALWRNNSAKGRISGRKSRAMGMGGGKKW